MVAGREFSVKKTLFAEFVKSEGVLPPTGGSFGGLTAFAFSPITCIHTAPERKRRLKTIFGSEEDEEAALADAENESIHLPMTRDETARMLNGIIFALKQMNKNNHTLASYPYTRQSRKPPVP